MPAGAKNTIDGSGASRATAENSMLTTTRTPPVAPSFAPNAQQSVIGSWSLAKNSGASGLPGAPAATLYATQAASPSVGALFFRCEFLK